MSTTEMLTAAHAAAERGLSPSWMRGLISAYGVAAIARQSGRGGANLYLADHLRAIPGPARGQRNDLLGDRIGRLCAAARRVAEARGTRDEYDKHFDQILIGNPAAVQALLAATRRWTKRKPVPAGVTQALEEVERAAEEVGELPTVLPMSVRARIVLVTAKANLCDT